MGGRELVVEWLRLETNGTLLLLRPVHRKEGSGLETTFSKALGGTSQVCPQRMGHYKSQGGSWRTGGWRRSERKRTGHGRDGEVRGREEVRAER